MSEPKPFLVLLEKELEGEENLVEEVETMVCLSFSVVEKKTYLHLYRRLKRMLTRSRCQDWLNLTTGCVGSLSIKCF